MPANLREPVSLLTGTEEARAKICIPPSKFLSKNVGVTKWSRSISNYFARSGIRDEWAQPRGK